MSLASPSFDDIWKLFQEADRQLKETSKEIKELSKEVKNGSPAMRMIEQ